MFKKKKDAHTTFFRVRVVIRDLFLFFFFLIFTDAIGFCNASFSVLQYSTAPYSFGRLTRRHLKFATHTHTHTYTNKTYKLNCYCGKNDSYSFFFSMSSRYKCKSFNTFNSTLVLTIYI